MFFVILIFIFLKKFSRQVSKSNILINNKWNNVNDIYRNRCFWWFVFCDIFRNIQDWKHNCNYWQIVTNIWSRQIKFFATRLFVMLIWNSKYDIIFEIKSNQSTWFHDFIWIVLNIYKLFSIVSNDFNNNWMISKMNIDNICIQFTNRAIARFLCIRWRFSKFLQITQLFWIKYCLISN